MQPVPHNGFVVAKEKKQNEVSNLGFELPENSKNERNASLGEVVSVGGDIKAYPTPQLKPGDLFAYAPFGAVKLRIGTEVWLYIEFKDVLSGFSDAGK